MAAHQMIRKRDLLEIKSLLTAKKRALLNFSTVQNGGQVYGEIQKIERALYKILNGRYGICEDCGEPIERKRLELLPETCCCVDCQREHEARRGHLTKSA